MKTGFTVESYDPIVLILKNLNANVFGLFLDRLQKYLYYALGRCYGVLH